MVRALTGDFKARLLEIAARHRKRGNSSDFVYWTIRDAIRSGLYEPGDRITETEVEGMLAISRTPIRKALHRLEVQHLLVRTSQRGLSVPRLDINDLINNVEIEEVLFGLAARRAAQYSSESELMLMEETIAQMEKAWREEDLEMLSSASARFHDLIVSAAREARVRELIQHLSDLNPQLSLYEYSLPERIPEAIREHHAIYEAIRARDISAEDLARLHTRNAMLAQTRARHLSGE